MNRWQHIKYTLVVLIGLGFALLTTAQTIPKSLVLEYEFSLASVTLGVVEKRLSYQDGVFLADSIIKPNSVAKLLFNGEVEEQSTFKVEDNKMISLSFHAIRKNHKPYDRKALFNHQEKTVVYNTGKSEPLRDNTFDLGSFPFAFMLEDLNAIENKVYQINTGDGYRAYEVLKPQRQEISTPAGDFSTTKITLKRQNKDNRYYYVWLADKSQYPVMIVRNRKGKESTLILSAITE